MKRDEFMRLLNDEHYLLCKQHQNAMESSGNSMVTMANMMITIGKIAEEAVISALERAGFIHFDE